MNKLATLVTIAVAIFVWLFFKREKTLKEIILEKEFEKTNKKVIKQEEKIKESKRKLENVKDEFNQAYHDYIEYVRNIKNNGPDGGES